MPNCQPDNTKLHTPANKEDAQKAAQARLDQLQEEIEINARKTAELVKQEDKRGSFLFGLRMQIG